MKQPDKIYSYVAVIGDIKDSRHLENRKEVQIRLQKVMDHINQIYKEDIASGFLITLGDEFQGLMHKGKNVLDMINKIKMEMFPVQLRFGIGFGQVTTDIRKEMALGADGPGYYRAREAVELLKENEKKNRSVPSGLCVRMDEKDSGTERMLNTIFELIYVLENSWTDRQREIAWDMLLHKDGQKNTADRFCITQSTVQKTLAAGSYYTYEHALKNVSEIFGEIQND